MRTAPCSVDHRSMADCGDPATARIEIEYVPGANPIRGSIRDPGGSRSSFSGWLELLGALERLGGVAGAQRAPTHGTTQRGSSQESDG